MSITSTDHDAARTDLIILRSSRIVAHHICSDARQRLELARELLVENPRLLSTTTPDSLSEADRQRSQRVLALLPEQILSRISDPDAAFHELSKLCADWGVQLTASAPIDQREQAPLGWTLLGRWHEDELIIDHAVRGNHTDHMPEDPEHDQPWAEHLPLNDLDEAIAAARHSAASTVSS